MKTGFEFRMIKTAGRVFYGRCVMRKNGKINLKLILFYIFLFNAIECEVNVPQIL